MSSTITTTVHNAKKIEFERMDVGRFQAYKVTISDKHGSNFTVSAYVDNEDMDAWEEQWNDPQPAPLVSEDFEDVVNALSVFMLDRTVRAVLDRIDPKGVDQARAALKRIGREV